MILHGITFPDKTTGCDMDDHEKNLRAAIKRLAASNTRIKRKHARVHLRSVLGKIHKDLMDQYPIIGKDGQEQRPPKRPACPVCGIPHKNWVALARHCGAGHGRRQPREHFTYDITCWCGKTWTWDLGQSAIAKASELGFARHLAGIKDLKAHILLGVLKDKGV